MNQPTVSCHRTHRSLRVLLPVIIVGFAHWFFGNLYEQVVLTPNMLGLGVKGLELWRQFFQFSDPRYYFVPYNPIAILLTFVALTVGWRSSLKQRKWLTGTAFFALCTGLLTLYIITQVNLKIYFGSLSEDVNWLRSMQQLGATLGSIRLGLEAATLYCALRAYVPMFQAKS